MLKLFDGEFPNATHFLLAQLAAKGYLSDIITTNFDRLVEIALAKLGVTYSAYCTSSEFETIEWRERLVRVIKIHGSIEREDSIAVTLRLVSQKLLAQAREAVIEGLFLDGQHRTVLVLGYSCSDVFDLSPAISAVSRSPKEIVFVEHTEMSKARVEPFTSRVHKNPFIQFQYGSRLCYDTDALVTALCVELGLPHIDNSMVRRAERDWKSIVSQWATQYRRSNGVTVPAVHGKLLLLSGKFPEAVAALRDAASLSEEEDKEGLHADILNHLGVAYDRCHQYDEAVDCFEQAIEGFREIGDRSREAHAIGNIGSILAMQGQYDAAIEVHGTALTLAKDAGDRQTEQVQLDSLGLIARYLGRYEDSVVLHDAAISIGHEIGNVHGLAIAYGNLGLAYRYRKRYDQAENCHERALRYSMEMGDRVAIGNQLGNLGLVYSGQGDLENAIRHHTKALEIALSISHLPGTATQLANMGFVCSKQYRFNDAVKYHNEALGVEISLGRKAGVARVHDNLAGAYFALGEFEDAAKAAEAGLTLYELLYGKDDYRYLELRSNSAMIHERLRPHENEF